VGGGAIKRLCDDLRQFAIEARQLGLAAVMDEWDNIGGRVRAFDGPEWRIKHTTDRARRADIVVSVVGRQYADGHAEREIVMDCPDTPIITPAQARKLARALNAAAHSADRVCDSGLRKNLLGGTHSPRPAPE
jgi:hypothetical protein